MRPWGAEMTGCRNSGLFAQRLSRVCTHAFPDSPISSIHALTHSLINQRHRWLAKAARSDRTSAMGSPTTVSKAPSQPVTNCAAPP